MNDKKTSVYFQYPDADHSGTGKYTYNFNIHVSVYEFILQAVYGRNSKRKQSFVYP